MTLQNRRNYYDLCGVAPNISVALRYLLQNRMIYAGYQSNPHKCHKVKLLFSCVYNFPSGSAWSNRFSIVQLSWKMFYLFTKLQKSTMTYLFYPCLHRMGRGSNYYAGCSQSPQTWCGCSELARQRQNFSLLRQSLIMTAIDGASVLSQALKSQVSRTSV